MPDINDTPQAPAARPDPSHPLASRTPEQREVDLEFIADLYAGKRLIRAEIVRRLQAHIHPRTISPNAVYNDIRTLEKRWASSLANNTIAEWKAKELVIIERLEAEAIEAYERSKRDAQSISGSVTGDDSVGGTRNVTKTRRDGDPRWLDIMIKLGERKDKLLGLASPIKLDATVKNGDLATLDSLRSAYRSRMMAEIKNELPKKDGNGVIDVELVGGNPPPPQT